MDNILDIMKTDKDSIQFNSVKISIISPEQVLANSYGEIKKPETINYRTFKAERDGLFCSKIFGPIKDYECLCGKYKKLKHRGIICEKCGVEVTTSKIRRSRIGHVTLVTPIAHIWFLKSSPSKFSLLLNISLKNIEKILYFEKYIVINPGSTSFKKNQLITEYEYSCISTEDKKTLNVKTGGQTLLDLLKDINLEEEFFKVQKQFKKKISQNKIKYLTKKLKLIKNFIKSNNKPEWMMTTILPILPPDLRPLVALDGGKFASSDINDLYRRIISRNNRIQKLTNLNAPPLIIKNEKRMLQEAVDALIDNDKKGRPITNSNKRPLKSLTDILKGKQGRFRLNLLGKRVDYSGRTVIIVGPNLKLHQCGIPKTMALELFKPFIFSEMKRRNISKTIKKSKKLLEEPTIEIFNILKEITNEYPILLNRAPTLHRLSIQAFEPILIEGKAIQLHPLVCTAFNADFDGDQMAVHIPVTIEAQIEARILMMSTNNLLSPASGEPIIIPSQDMVLGIYYISKMKNYNEDKIEYFKCNRHLYYRYENNTLDLHTPIYYKYKNTYIKTTYGRLILKNTLNENLDFDLVNRIMTKKEISNLISMSYKKTGLLSTIYLLEKLKEIGFYHSTKSGISIGMDDLVIPNEKKIIIKDTEDTIMKLDEEYFYGLISKEDRYNKILDIWSDITEIITKEVVKNLKDTRTISRTGEIYEDSFNTMFMITESGARGSITQIRQLVGIRGLMTKPSGLTVETPVIASFKEGLTILQYFISTHGARKGLADTALKTANSGYLTRRLVDVAQDIFIKVEDCYTDNYISISTIVENPVISERLKDRIKGRVIQENIFNKKGEKIVDKGEILTEEKLDLIDELNIEFLKIRSVITCELDSGICAKCYGIDLTTSRLIEVGEAAGVIAAQSIGEPGTQLTMRTFHMGGITSRVVGRNYIQSKIDGFIELKNARLLKYGNTENFIVISKSCSFTIIAHTKKEKENYKIPYGSIIKIKNKTNIKINDIIAQWDPHNYLIIAEMEGIIKFVNIIDGITIKSELDEVSGFSTLTVINFEKKINYLSKSKPSIVIIHKKKSMNYYLSPGTIITVKDEQSIKIGDTIGKIPRDALLVGNEIGGLSKVAEIFEARMPKKPAILAPEDGVVRYIQDHKGKKRLFIINNNNVGKEIPLKTKKTLTIFENEYVKRGDLVADGEQSLQDILYYSGINELTEKMKREVQGIYKSQGVKIDDRHIEIIIKQMIKKVLILDPGDSDFLANTNEDYSTVKRKNNILKIEKKKLITYKRLILGISKISIETNSFLSAASFQETTKVLVEAAICNKKDKLLGLKENVITGKLIPSGTGFYKNIEQ